MARTYRLGFAAVVMLVLLRITIGWHFLYQGLWKYTSPEFSAESYLKQAKGPLGSKYRNLIPDVDGRERVGKWSNADLQWDNYWLQFQTYYATTPAQKLQGEKALGMAKEELKETFEPLQEEIDLHYKALDALEAAEQGSLVNIPFQQKRNWERRQELTKAAAGWLAKREAIEESLESNLFSILTPQQQTKAAMPQELTQFDWMNLLIVYSLMAIGVCLMVGLLTPFAAWGGALFLLSVVLAQPGLPWVYPPPHPSQGESLFVTKEFIEMIALLVLGTAPVGRWGGLDFFLHYLIVKPLLGRKSEYDYQ